MPDGGHSPCLFPSQSTVSSHWCRRYRDVTLDRKTQEKKSNALDFWSGGSCSIPNVFQSCYTTRPPSFLLLIIRSNPGSWSAFIKLFNSWHELVPSDRSVNWVQSAFTSENREYQIVFLHLSRFLLLTFSNCVWHIGICHHVISSNRIETPISLSH